MLASVQKSEKAHTNATELRETRLAITENTEKKDVYLSSFQVNQLMVCEDKKFETYSKICQAENVVSRRIQTLLSGYSSLSYNLQAYSGDIIGLYTSKKGWNGAESREGT